jgi:hypothetical protein
VEAKASDLIAPVTGSRRAEAIIRAMRRIDTVPDVVGLRRLWQMPNRGVA